MSEYDPNYVEVPVYARVGGKVVLFNTKGQLLFIRRSDKCSRPYGWDLIGGGLDKGENAYEGMKREGMEETGLAITDIKPVYVSSFMGANDEFIVMIGYRAEILEDKDPVLSWEHDQFKWVDAKDALAVELPEFHAMTVKKALE